MTRMLEALKQLDARSPHLPETGQAGLSKDRDVATRETSIAVPHVEEPVIPEATSREPALPEPAAPPPKSGSTLPLGMENRCYHELAENVLARLPKSGRAMLGFVSAIGDPPPEGLVRGLASLLVGRTEGGVLLIERAGPEASSLPDHSSVGTWAEVFSGNMDWEALVSRTDVEGLDILVEPARPFPSPEQSPGWDPIGFVKVLREAYALVLFDAVALNDLDGLPWIGCCDGTYLLVYLNHTPCRAARRAAREIRKRGGRFMGCIVLE